MQYLNTPLRGIGRFPAQLATGRQLRDSVPMAKQYYGVDAHWKATLRHREAQMAESAEKVQEEYYQGIRQLSTLRPGDRVRMQNPATKVWDRVGMVVEANAFRQYVVRLDGSGRLSLRN